MIFLQNVLFPVTFGKVLDEITLGHSLKCPQELNPTAPQQVGQVLSSCSVSLMGGICDVSP